MRLSQLYEKALEFDPNLSEAHFALAAMALCSTIVNWTVHWTILMR